MAKFKFIASAKAGLAVLEVSSEESWDGVRLISNKSGNEKASKLTPRLVSKFLNIFHFLLTTSRLLMIGIGFSLDPKNRYPSTFNPKSKIVKIFFCKTGVI